MRIAIFCFFGPPLGALFLIAPTLFATAWGYGPFNANPGALSGLLFVLLFSYLPGFVPAIVTSQVDDYLSDKLSRWPRAVVTGLAGAVVAAAWFSLLLLSQGQGWTGLLAAPIGVFPAVVCSWLSDRWASGGAAGTSAAPEAGHTIDRT